MEGLTRLVSESLARHGFDRPLDYRRLHWSRWFRCESHHSLLLVPSKPGVFAVAEEVSANHDSATSAIPPTRNEAERLGLSPVNAAHNFAASTAEVRPAEPDDESSRRLLSVVQFFEDDDMAYVLDRMISYRNPMGTRLSSGRYFVRFVVIEDPIQRRSICSALNQWIVSSAETTGIGAHFASSLELTSATEFISSPDPNQGNLFGANATKNEHVERTLMPASRSSAASSQNAGNAPATAAAPQLDSGAAANLHCPTPFPSGF